MPRPFSSTFVVRYYECDGYGHVNNTNYLRYLSETALAAAAAAGNSIDGCEWQPRSTDIEYLRPVRYGETVRVDTWVTGLEGADLSRAYEFYLAGAETLAARASTRGTLVDHGGLPLPIPRALAEALAPHGLAAERLAAEVFPVAPPMPPGVYTLHRRVRWQDLNMARQVDPATYLDYIEECSFGVVAAFGWPAQRMAAHGFAILLRRHQIEYLQPAQVDDELVLATWASDIKRATALRHYTITRPADGALLARVHTLGVWVELASGRPMRIPPGFLDDFAPNLVYGEVKK